MLDYQEIRLEINLKFIRALVMTDPSICTERDLAKFRSLSKSHSEKSKFLQDFSQVFKERISIQESYVMEMTKLSSQIDALTSQGALNNILITLKAAYQQKLLMEQNFLVVLKKEVTESLEEIVKRHNTEFNTIMVEKKQLEKEHKHFFERTEISQKTHFLQGRERDAMALEIESFNLRRKLADQRQQKASEKLNNMTKIWTHGANEYRTNVGEYNFFLEKFGTTLKKMNMQMRTQEVEKVTFSLGAIKKIVCNEPGLSAPLPEIEKLRNTLEGVNIKQEINESTDSAQSASLKMEVMSYESFLQRELKEITTVNEKEEEIVRSFRKHYEDILKRQVLAETCLFEVPGPESNGEEEKQKHQEIQQNINFLAKLVDIAWRGQPVVTADLKKFHRMLGDKFLRKIFTAAVQQYRLSDKFVLTDDGFKNTTKILVHFLYACFKIKDATSIMKVMILSLTFWKVDLQKSQEKCYLHSKIVWHPVWRDLDFWSTSILLSIRDELRFQKNLEECETPNETAERERNIVFGQLSSFSYNMVTFMVDKNETKKMLEKFSSYYDLQNEQIKLLLNNIDTMTRQHEQTLVMDKIKKDQEGPKPVVKMSLISNYFGAKKSAVSSDTSDSKSTSDNQMGMEATKMIEEFKIEFEDDSLFHEVYGTNRGFSYGGEAGSVEKFLKQGFSYGSEISISKLDVSQESENRKSQTWF